MASVVAMSSALAARLLAEAAASSDAEVCGLLLGTPGRIEAATACRNVAADPARRFEIDPAALLAAHRAARAGGAAVIGCHHSHPSGRPVPSARDGEDAAPDGSVWLIAAGGELLAWRAVADGRVAGRFDPLTIVVDAR